MCDLRKAVMREIAGDNASANAAHSRSDEPTQIDLSASIVGNAACTAAVWKVLGSRRIC